MMRYAIIGSGIAGMSAAKAVREADPDGDVHVYTTEFHPLGHYARKDMAYRLAEGGFDHDDLLIEDVEALNRQGINLHYDETLRIFPTVMQILKKHHIRHRYDRLLLATGASPKLVEAPGLHFIGVHQVRNSDDFSLIQAWLPELRTRGAVVIGGGILALDMVYALRRLRIPVTLVVREDHIGAPLLPASASGFIEALLQADEVDILKGRILTAYLSEDDRVLDGVRLDDGRELPARMALCAVGVMPNIDLARDAGIEWDVHTGAITVDSRMRTTVPHIFAAGNCAVVNGIVAHNWEVSAEQGRIAGWNMAGHDTVFAPRILGDAKSRIYGQPLATFRVPEPHPHASTRLYEMPDGFAELTFDARRLIGGVLIGCDAQMVNTFWRACLDQRAIADSDLDPLMFNAQIARSV